jgi:predicted DNA-binding WGR domain protein
VLRSVDPAKNRFRAYRLYEQKSLFGEHVLIVQWGRIGQTMRERVEHFGTQADLARRRAELLGRRARHGYTLAPGE